MAPLVTMLKLKLGAFGWHESVRREQRHYEGAAEVVAELDDYLERMGIRCAGKGAGGSGTFTSLFGAHFICLRTAATYLILLPSKSRSKRSEGSVWHGKSIQHTPVLSLSCHVIVSNIKHNWFALSPCRDTNVRARLTGATVPIANLNTLGSAAEQRFRPAQLISCVNTRPQPADPSLAPIILVGDADPYMPELMHALGQLPRAVYLVSLPPERQLAGLRSCRALAGLMLAAGQSKVPRGPCVVAGVGAGGVVAHELALQLHNQGHEVRHSTNIEFMGVKGAKLCSAGHAWNCDARGCPSSMSQRDAVKDHIMFAQCKAEQL